MSCRIVALVVLMLAGGAACANPPVPSEGASATGSTTPVGTEGAAFWAMLAVPDVDLAP
jgi:hypothetical protein